MNNISDKDAMQLKEFAEYCKLKGHAPQNWLFELWQAAYESCLSEFEQVAQCYVNSDGECEEIEYTGSMEQWDDDFTPLFTRKV
jgi:hypothetical protein